MKHYIAHLEESSKSKTKSKSKLDLRNIRISPKVYLQSGINPKFYKLMKALYEPFLNGHLDDKYQYSVYDDGKLIGFFQIGAALDARCQIAFVPGYVSRGLGSEIIKKVTTLLNKESVGWTSHVDNYPSLKLLLTLGGEISRVYHVDLNPKNDKFARGFLNLNKASSKDEQKLLNKTLTDSKDGFQKWLNIFKTRIKEINDLKDYLK